MSYMSYTSFRSVATPVSLYCLVGSPVRMVGNPNRARPIGDYSQEPSNVKSVGIGFGVWQCVYDISPPQMGLSENRVYSQ